MVNQAGRNKRKNINDPVYGFITIPDDTVFDLIEHPWFQRLRRIKQLGLTYYVYPSATHSRFQHALGCMHLMKQTLQVLRSKGIAITQEEEEGVTRAILLHDIGHGPFSHTLEQSLVTGLTHEELSLLFMEELNRQFSGCLETAIAISETGTRNAFSTSWWPASLTWTASTTSPATVFSPVLWRDSSIPTESSTC